jgi:broad specificity phosphatase PhoE
MRAIFIRHGQSTGNVGIPANDLSLLELTDLGWRESREVAASWTEIPSLIVTSPYHRAISRCGGRGVADPGVHLP